MTKDELIKYFSNPNLDYLREHAYRIMLERPDIADPLRIEFAAEQMHESEGDRIELSVYNALRLTESDKVVPIDKLMKELTAVGVADDNMLDVILGAELEDYSDCKPSRNAERKFKILNINADILAKNEDIVIVGRPEFYPGCNWGRLALALFCPTLTADEQQIIRNMEHWCDETSVDQDKGYVRLIFYVNNIWLAG